jgi:hypothetical protein
VGYEAGLTAKLLAIDGIQNLHAEGVGANQSQGVGSQCRDPVEPSTKKCRFVDTLRCT